VETGKNRITGKVSLRKDGEEGRGRKIALMETGEYKIGSLTRYDIGGKTLRPGWRTEDEKTMSD